MEALCRQCGLCCDGTLFECVPLEAGDDPAALRTAGLTVVTGPSESVLQQPCAAHQGTACGVYAERPLGCRRFACRLIDRVSAGEESVDDAVRLIGRATALRARLREALVTAMPNMETYPLAAVERLIPPIETLAGDPRQMQRWATVLLSMAALDEILESTFRRRPLHAAPGPPEIH